MFVFLFKLKFRRKCYFWFSPLLCSVFIILINFSIEVNTTNCLDVKCMNNGVCQNGTCFCSSGWQGNFCQFCGGKVR